MHLPLKEIFSHCAKDISILPFSVGHLIDVDDGCQFHRIVLLFLNLLPKFSGSNTSKALQVGVRHAFMFVCSETLTSYVKSNEWIFTMSCALSPFSPSCRLTYLFMPNEYISVREYHFLHMKFIICCRYVDMEQRPWKAVVGQ